MISIEKRMEDALQDKANLRFQEPEWDKKPELSNDPIKEVLNTIFKGFGEAYNSKL